MEIRELKELKESLNKLGISIDRVKSIGITTIKVMDRVCPKIKIKLYKLNK